MITCGDPSARRYKTNGPDRCRCLACKACNATRSREWRRSVKATDKSATVATVDGELTSYEMTVTLDEWKAITGTVEGQATPHQWMRCSDPMAWNAYRTRA